MEVAVVGAGWAGLAAAVEATRSGAHVTLFEMAPAAGGRARDVISHGMVLDNGAHICIGAYAETLRLLRTVGVDEDAAFLRRPLTLVDADGFGLRMGSGPPLPAFVLAVLGRRGWRWRDRIALLRVASAWRRAGFRCAPERDRRRSDGSAADGGAPRLHRAALRRRPQHARRSSERHGLPARPARRARLDAGRRRPAAAAARPGRGLSGAGARLARAGGGDDPPGASRRAARAPRRRLARRRDAGRPRRRRRQRGRGDAPRRTARERLGGSCRAPCATSRSSPSTRAAPAARCQSRCSPCRPIAGRPAQFVFDRGRLGGEAGLLGFVISGASAWVERGAAATEEATLAQAREALARHLARAARGRPHDDREAGDVRLHAAARAAGHDRRPGLLVCGDYIDGPYPATLEGAVRSGVAAARAATG